MIPNMPNSDLQDMFDWMVAGVVHGGNLGRYRLASLLRRLRLGGHKTEARRSLGYACYVGYPIKGNCDCPESEFISWKGY